MIGNYSSTNDLRAPTNFFVDSGTVTVKAIGFTLPTGDNYTLDSVKLRLGNYNTTADGDVALLQIYKGTTTSSTNLTQATLEAVTFINPTSSSNTIGNFTFTPDPATPFTFLAGNRYWLSLDLTAGNGLAWRVNNPSITPIGVATSPAAVFSTTGALATGTSTAFNSFDIQATVATPVPFDFEPSFGVAVLGGGWLLRKHLKKKKSTKV